MEEAPRKGKGTSPMVGRDGQRLDRGAIMP
jgi:hypothetical protein